MVHVKTDTIQKLNEAFGFKVEVLSFANHNIRGEIRTRYTCKRPKGKKFYTAFMSIDGAIWI